MRTTADVAAGRWTRLLLVVATLFGLAVMHTLGHGTHAAGHEPVAPAHDGASAHEGAPPPSGTVGDHDAAGDVRLVAAGNPRLVAAGNLRLVAAVVPGDAGCPTGCPHGPLLAAGGTGGGFPDWGVCLAVLGAFGMSLLLAVLFATVTGAGEPGRRSGDRPPGASRAPPPRPVGLRLATVSVLRR
ncbi:hypothetical protein [Micromonospora sp. NPDC049497]|uniref:hypothetical protein n=1 Tax=Micromonospora sp. NPDC049497 TaxID=3364273 RepID=UPI00379D57D3